MEVTRRTFLKGTALGAVALTAAGATTALSGCSEPPATQEESAGEENVYTASHRGIHGDVTVKATIRNGTIEALEATAPLETVGIGDLALTQLPEKIISANSVDVDCIAGATFTSTALLKATAYCMAQAGMEAKGAPAVQNFTAGSYEAAHKGHSFGTVPVMVKFTTDKIDSITVGENGETPSLVKAAAERVAEQVTGQQTLAVDAVTGATYSTRAILRGIEDCVVQAGGDPQKLKRPVLDNPKPTEGEEMNCDVVIIGGGMSGTIALYRAALSGLNAICVESASVVGGMGEISGFMSMLWFGSDLQKRELGLSDEDMKTTVDEMAGAMVKAVVNEVDHLMIKRCCTECGPMVDMLYEAGMEMKVNDATGISIPKKGERFQFLHEKAAELGSKTLLDLRVDEILVDDTGTVTGVIATRRDSGKVKIGARAVILSSGGACSNHEMMLKYFPDYVNTVENCAISSDDGAGLLAAWNIGAAQGMFGVHAHGSTLPLTAKIAGVQTVEATDDMGTLGNIPLLWLDREGRRWTDESCCYVATPYGNAIYYGKRVFNVLDQATVDSLIREGTKIRPWRGKAVDTPLADLATQLADGETTGFVFKADTLEALSEKVGWDAAIAKIEIDRYNQIAQSGIDTDCGKGAEYLIYTVEAAPFYAVELHPRSLGSFGGLLLADNYGILNQDGKRIPGLYAAGDVSCGWFGRNYPDLDRLTSCHNAVSGYVVANSVLEYLA